MSLTLSRLTREERNGFLDRTIALQLDPNDFVWTEDDTRYASGVVLTHRPTRYTFKFSAYEDAQHRVHFSSTWTPMMHGRASASHSNRTEQLNTAREWLSVVKREHDLPDLWEALKKDRELFSAEVIDANGQFSRDERKLLSERLDQLMEQIARIAEADQSQRSALESDVAALKTAAETSTRAQWKLMFIGTIFQSILGLGLDPIRAQQVMHVATTYIGPLVAHIRGLLS